MHFWPLEPTDTRERSTNSSTDQIPPSVTKPVPVSSNTVPHPGVTLSPAHGLAAEPVPSWVVPYSVPDGSTTRPPCGLAPSKGGPANAQSVVRFQLPPLAAGGVSLYATPHPG